MRQRPVPLLSGRRAAAELRGELPRLRWRRSVAYVCSPRRRRLGISHRPSVNRVSLSDDGDEARNIVPPILVNARASANSASSANSDCLHEFAGCG